MIQPVQQYWFDEDAAQRAVDFFGQLVHIKGRKGGKPFVLEPWQQDITRQLFGWKRQDGSRRYRTAYVEIPRKNGKSTWCAGLALYLLFCDGEEGAEVYSLAGTRDQAKMVFDPACAMINARDWLKKNCTIRPSYNRVIYKNSFYRAVAAEAGPLHGTNPHGIIFDELHVQPNRDLWDTMQTGRGERRQPLTIAITTAGHDRSSICWEQHEYALGVRDGTIEDESFLPVVYAAEPDDPIDDPVTWARANPNLGVSVFPEYLAEESAKAKQTPSYENTFRRLHLNQWTEQAVRWLPMDCWDACMVEIDETELVGEPCYIGIDLGVTRDLSAMVAVFPGDDGGFTVLPKFWTPREAASLQDEANRRKYTNWARDGWIEFIAGTRMDQSVVRETLWEWSERFDIRCVGADPWNMEEFYQQMLKDGWEEDRWLMFRQSFATFNEPMKATLDIVRDGKLRHDGHPVLRDNAASVVAKEDPSGNLRPDKGKSQGKIDGFVAMLMGIGLALQNVGADVDYYTDGIKALD